MSTSGVVERNTGSSPQFIARMAGACYMLTVVTGMYAALAGRRVEALFVAANVIAGLSYVATTLLLYEIFRPVNRNLSMVAALFSLTGCTVGILTLLGLISLPIHNMVFFAFYCLLIGYLIFRATFLPRFLAAMMVIAGLGWLTFLSPALGTSLFSYTMITGLVGEGTLTLWLLVKGVDVSRWKQQAGEDEAGRSPSVVPG